VVSLVEAISLIGVRGVVLSDRGILNSNMNRRAGSFLAWENVGAVLQLESTLLLVPVPGVVCPVKRRWGILGLLGRNAPVVGMTLPSRLLRMERSDQLELLRAMLKIEPQLRSQEYANVISSFLVEEGLTEYYVRRTPAILPAPPVPTPRQRARA
jgi:hypothetical protein